MHHHRYPVFRNCVHFLALGSLITFSASARSASLPAEAPEPFEPAYNVDYSATGNKPAVLARLWRGPAHTGGHAIVLGLDEHHGTRNKLDFRLDLLKPSASYVMQFAVKIIGPNSQAQVGIQSGKDYSFHPFNATSFSTQDAGGWSYLTYEYCYEPSAPFDTVTSFYLTVSYAGPAKSGMLIDSLSMREKGLEDDWHDAPNILPIGNVEFDSPTGPHTPWDRLTARQDTGKTRPVGSSSQSPPAFGAYHVSIAYDTKCWKTLLTDEKYKYFNTFILEGRNFEVDRYEARQLRAAGRKGWLMTYYLITRHDEAGKLILRDDWRDRIRRHAEMCRCVLGDDFEGFYFDEPFHHFRGEDFAEITAYLRKTYQRRVFAVQAGVSFAHPSWVGQDILTYVSQPGNPVVWTAENMKWVTDVGYCQYQTWAPAADTAADLFRRALRLASPDVRVWIVPMLGTFDWTQTEEDNLTIIRRMFARNCGLPNFGGVLFYTMSSCAVPVSRDDRRLAATGGVIVNNTTQLSESGRYVEGGGAYYVIHPDASGQVRWKRVANALEIIGRGFQSGLPLDRIQVELDKIE